MRVVACGGHSTMFSFLAFSSRDAVIHTYAMYLSATSTLSVTFLISMLFILLPGRRVVVRAGLHLVFWPTEPTQ